MYLQLFLLFLMVLIGGFIGLYVDSDNRSYLKSALTFSASFIIGITILHLLPIVYTDYDFWLGVWILAGFFVQIFLEMLTSGVEHGHIHEKHKPSNIWAFQILIGLGIHAFVEGMPLSGLVEHTDSHLDHNHHQGGVWIYFMSLVLHKIPAAYALVLLLKGSKIKTKYVVISLFIFALMSPIGALFIQFFNFSASTFQILMAFVTGSFLHIATTIMFESDGSHNHNISYRKVLFSVLGIGTAILAEVL